MTYQQYNYSYSSPVGNSSLANSQLLVPGSGSLSNSSASPCDVTARVLTSESNTPSGGSAQQSMYSASGLLSYPRVAGLADSVYSSAYATQGYVPFGADPSAFYSPLAAADNSDAWRTLSGTAGWAYDPNSMAGYPYGTSYGGLDVRRKNATRESTSTLKAWLYEHIKNPYPTKGEKIMLAIITKMTLTQVSTWFANARRRLKKENKMQWSPRNRSGEDDDHKSDDENDDADGSATNDSSQNQADSHTGSIHNNNNNKPLAEGAKDINSNGDDLGFNRLIHDSGAKDLIHNGRTTGSHHILSNGHDSFATLAHSDDPLHIRREDDEDIIVDGGDNDLSRLDFPGHDHPLSHPRLKADESNALHHHKLDTFDESPLSQLSTPLGSPHHSLGDALLSQGHHMGTKGHDNVISVIKNDPMSQVDINKPRIWSLADVATSSTPPLGRRSPNSLVSSSHSLGGGVLNKGGLTAFTTPVTSQGHMSGFQPWIPGSYAHGASHNPSGLSSYGYALNSHQSLGGASGQMGVSQTGHSLGGIGGLSNSYSTSSKLSSGFLGYDDVVNQ